MTPKSWRLSAWALSLPAVRFLLLLALAPLASAEAPFQRSVWHPELTEVRLSDIETRLGSAVLEALKRSEPVLDAPLVEAARLYAERDGNPGDALIASGVSDAYVVPIRYVARTKDLLAPVRQLLRDRIDAEGITHFGVGVAPPQAGHVIALLCVRRGAELARFPKAMPLGQRFLLNGRLQDGLDHPRVLVADPTGHIRDVEPRHRGQVFWITLSFEEGPGAYTVEVQAKNKFGTQVLNIMEVHAANGTSEPTVPLVRLRPPAVLVRSAEEAERRSLALLNHTRESMGFQPLRGSADLTVEAEEHARDMAETGFFGHQSPKRGGLPARLQRARIAYTLALENIALGPSPDSVHADLIRSPSHLRNILDPDVSHVGVGVYEERSGPEPVYIITQIFGRFRPL